MINIFTLQTESTTHQLDYCGPSGMKSGDVRTSRAAADQKNVQ